MNVSRNRKYVIPKRKKSDALFLETCDDKKQKGVLGIEKKFWICWTSRKKIVFFIKTPKKSVTESVAVLCLVF